MEEKFEISVSDKADKQIKEHLIKRGTPNSLLRLGVKGSGCNGFSYFIQFEDSPPSNRDIVCGKVIVDNKSIIHLNGSTLDWEKTLLSSGYKIINPQEKSRCGCGISFSLK